MKKKILAAALASVMALTNVSALFAAEEPGQSEAPEGPSITLGDFNSDRTNMVELESGDTLTFNFHNKSNGTSDVTNNWDDFVFGVTNAAAGEEEEVLFIRADLFTFAPSGFSDLTTDWTNDIEWVELFWENVWIPAMKAGVNVEATISRNGNTLEYSAKIGEWTVSCTAVSGKELPETLYVFLTGEKCTLTGIKAYKNGEPVEPIVPEAPEPPEESETPEGPSITLGDFNSDRTNMVELESGDTLTFNFHNKSNGTSDVTNNWDDFVFGVTNAAAGEEEEVLFIRADLFAFAPSGFSDLTTDWTNDIEWVELFWENVWIPAMKAGVNVEATISRNGDTLEYSAKIGEWTVSCTAVSGKELPETLYVFLTGEKCTLTGIKAYKNGEPVEPIVPEAPEVPEIPEGAISLGNLTVTDFYVAKTSAVELKSGESLTLKFNNKSNGTNNWDNFVLAVAGDSDTSIEGYKGYDYEVLNIRSDAWGWGGGLSDINDPRGDSGPTNLLVFKSEVNWDNWVAGANAGYDVDLTISRYEDTFKYEAKIGEYTVNTAITSGKKLPADLYVFLTGEKCVLSNIIATKGDGVVLEAVEPVNKPTEPVTIPEGAFQTPAAPAESAELGDSNTISNDLTVTSFFAEKTPAVTLVSGGSYTFKFKNKSNGFNNWDNFVMAVTGEIGSAYTGADQEILVIRADSWGWGGGYSDFVAPDQSGNALVFDTNIDWDKWVAGARAGYDVEITISRDGNTLTYDAKIGDYYVKLKATSGKALPKNTYVFFTGENCVLSGITTTNNNPSALGDTSEPEEETATTTAAATEPIEAAPAETTTVDLGDLTVTNFFAEKTNAVELKNGGSYTFKFNNKSNGTNNWENFVMAVTGETGAAYTGADQEILVIRADSWGWGGGYSDFVAPDQAGNALVFDTNIDWDKWVAGAQAGYDVEITIGKNGNTLTYDAKIGDYYVKLTATSGKALPDSAYVFFTGENCVLSGITATDNNPAVSGNTAPASQDTSSSAPQATTAAQDTAAPAETAKPAAPISLGNLTVTNFFNEKTAAVELKSGESYSFKFNNKSNGTNNWDNFILAIAGETGAAYTGADQEVLIIRADNWGWGGGYSDFVSPDQAGNALVFDTNIDWDKWVAGAQAGYDVNITLTRSGNTLKYYASIGDYYVKLTATSGKKLPETLYVFLTGENCVLSGITATALTDSSPNTGIAAPCALAVVAIASSAAIVILKKKSAK